MDFNVITETEGVIEAIISAVSIVVGWLLRNLFNSKKK